MVDPVTIGKGALAVGKGVLAIKKAFEECIETPPYDWLEKCRDETLRFAQTVAVGILWELLGRAPRDPEVQALLAEIANGSSFPPRTLRLLSEMVRSPSEVRRRRLVAVLIAGPKVTDSDAERDRLDLLAEQLLEEDIVTVKSSVDAVTRRSSQYGMVVDSDCSFHVRSDERAGLPAGKAGISHNHADIDLVVDRISLDRLVAAGCLRYLGDGLVVTALGAFLLEKMDHQVIRAGVASGDSDEPK